MIITFCGHSDFLGNDDYKNRILAILEKEIGNSGGEIYLGEYGGFDRFCYECAKIFKQTHQKASLVYVTPYLSKISKETRERYNEIIYPELENVPKKYAILERNKYMIKKADIVIAHVERSWGGAYKSLLLAKKLNKRIYNLADK